MFIQFLLFVLVVVVLVMVIINLDRVVLLVVEVLGGRMVLL